MAILKLLQGAIINRLYVKTNKKVESLHREIKARETNWNFKIKKYSNTKHSNKTKILWDGFNIRLKRTKESVNMKIKKKKEAIWSEYQRENQWGNKKEPQVHLTL